MPHQAAEFVNVTKTVLNSPRHSLGYRNDMLHVTIGVIIWV